MKRALAFVYGSAVYLFSLFTFLYVIGFVGNLAVPKSVDTGRPSRLGTALWIDMGLLVLFAVQHNVMARQGFRRGWTRIISTSIERSTYVLATSLLLALLCWQWRPIHFVIWQVTAPWGGIALQAVFAAGWLTVLLATFIISHFELLGLQQVYVYLRGRSFVYPPFATPYLYKYVRHPIYLGLLLGVWSTPTMTAGHLLFSVAASGYIFVGIFFEERDLVHVHGEAYRTYQREVPMIVPLGRKQPAEVRTKAAGQP